MKNKKRSCFQDPFSFKEKRLIYQETLPPVGGAPQSTPDTFESRVEEILEKLKSINKNLATTADEVCIGLLSKPELDQKKHFATILESEESRAKSLLEFLDYCDKNLDKLVSHYSLGEHETAQNEKAREITAHINGVIESGEIPAPAYVYLGETDGTDHILRTDIEWHKQKADALGKIATYTDNIKIEGINYADYEEPIAEYIALVADGGDAIAYVRNNQEKFLKGGTIFDLALAFQRAEKKMKEISGKGVEDGTVYTGIMMNLKLNSSTNIGESFRKSAVLLDFENSEAIEPPLAPIPPVTPDDTATESGLPIAPAETAATGETREIDVNGTKISIPADTKNEAIDRAEDMARGLPFMTVHEAKTRGLLKDDYNPIDGYSLISDKITNYAVEKTELVYPEILHKDHLTDITKVLYDEAKRAYPDATQFQRTTTNYGEYTYMPVNNELIVEFGKRYPGQTSYRMITIEGKSVLIPTDTPEEESARILAQKKEIDFMTKNEAVFRNLVIVSPTTSPKPVEGYEFVDPNSGLNYAVNHILEEKIASN